MPVVHTNHIQNSPTLVEIAQLTGSARRRAVGDYLACRAALIRQIAVGICQRNNLKLTVHVEDVMSEVHVIAVAMFNELGDNSNTWSNFEAMLTTRARRQIAERLNGAEWTGISGDTAAAKRRRLIYRTQTILMEAEGILYEGQALIDKHNERMLATRADAARQAVLAALDDLRAVDVHSVGEWLDVQETWLGLAPGADEASAAEWEEMLGAVLPVLGNKEKLMPVMRLLLEEAGGRAEIARRLGISKDLAGNRVAEVRSAARKALAAIGVAA